MSNSHVHPIMAGLLDAFSAPRLPDGLTGESLAAALRAQGLDARTAEPVAEQSAPTLLTRCDRAYSHSKICRARKAHDCEGCDELIVDGERYLRYQLSREISYGLHLTCAELRSENGSLVYDCRSLRVELGIPLRSVL